MAITIERAGPGDLEAVLALLRRARLPEGGLRDHVATLLVARASGPVVGSAALELYGRAALLRSVAVETTAQGQGLGRRLAEAAVTLARESGVERLFLLTETAAPFFARLGYSPVERSAVPADLLASPEFASLCPASAQAMVRDL